MIQRIKNNFISFSTVLVFILALKAIYYLSSDAFWEGFLSNLLATVIGLIIGIPVAIYISNYQEKASEKERKEKIIELLREELFVNLNHLISYAKNTDKDAILLVLSGFLKDESWRAFSEGGELEWIKDPKLLSDISWAYSSIQTVKYILEKHYSLIYHTDYRLNKQQGMIYLRDMVEKGIIEAITDIEKAIKAMK